MHDKNTQNWSDLQAKKVVCGISWDPHEKVTLKEKLKTVLGRNKETYDLDLSAYLYGENTALLDYVTGNAGETSDKTGFVLHSGDDRDGKKDGYDEHIIADIRHLPLYVTDIVFVAEVASAHAFKHITHPYIELADAETHDTIKQKSLKNDPDTADTSAYVFTHLHRVTGTIWRFKHVNHFVDHESIEDWSDYLANFLS